MSRTDKDAPGWIRSVWWRPAHNGCRYDRFYRGRECALPPEPVRARPARFSWHSNPPLCTWRPTWDHYRRVVGAYSAPTWYVRLHYTRPQRRRTRDELTLARQQYRATGDVDIVAGTDQHRHRARWSWW